MQTAWEYREICDDRLPVTVIFSFPRFECQKMVCSLEEIKHISLKWFTRLKCREPKKQHALKWMVFCGIVHWNRKRKNIHTRRTLMTYITETDSAESTHFKCYIPVPDAWRRFSVSIVYFFLISISIRCEFNIFYLSPFLSYHIKFLTQATAGWICCMPCVWLRTSATVHKIALTTATLLVTSLLVASPVLFLLSTAPSQLPKDCNTKSDVNCISTRSMASSTLECNAAACRQATISILTRSNWKVDPCKDFASFSCGSTKNNAKAIKSVQEGVDTIMQRKWQAIENTN